MTNEDRIAILKFLDPEDEAMVERIGMEIANEWDGSYSIEQAKRIIAALRRAAGEGEPNA